MPIKKSGLSRIFQISFALCVAVLCISGCLEKPASPVDQPSSILSDKDSRLQMDYDVELSCDLFRLQGDLLFPGAADLGYILLNASLRKEMSPVLSTKYLLMQVEADREYGFEICKSCRLESGDYDCILRAEAPQGVIAEEVRKVSLMESRDRPEGWSQAEESAFWQMIEEYERVEDVGKENERDDGVGKADEGADGVGKADEGADGVGKENERADGVGKENEGDEDGLSSHEDALVGSKSSKKYHRPDCRFAQKIKPENLISFSGVEDARREGYLPCKVCNP